jgi:hypothetical protein
MKSITNICLLLSFVTIASAEIVRPPGYDNKPATVGITEAVDPYGRPVRVIQLPSKIVTVNVPGKTETRYVTLPEKKKVVPATEFAAMKKEWDDELEASQCEIALKYAYRLDVTAIEGDTLGNAKKDDVDKAAKACAAAPSAITRKALVGAVERMIAR